MVTFVTQLAEMLRRLGVPCSPAEVIDAVSALEVVGLERRDHVEQALLATLVKRTSDRAIFESLFDLLWRAAAIDPARMLRSALRSAGVTDEEIEHLLAELATALAALSPTARLAAAALAPGQGQGMSTVESAFARLLALAGLVAARKGPQHPLRLGQLSQQISAALGASSAESEWGQLAARLAGSLGEARAAEVAREAFAALGKLRGDLRTEVEEATRSRRPTALGTPDPLMAPLPTLSADELAALRVEVTRLAERLRRRAVKRLRRRTRPHGRLDVRQTLRGSLATAGVPFSPRFRRKRPHRMRLVVLCDVSDSVRHVSRFMLELTYLLGDRFDRVHTFVFVNELADVTQLFARTPIERAIGAVESGQVVNLIANSNFGACFHALLDRHLHVLDRRTTVLVLGDGRNNYQPSRIDKLERIARSARRIWWLTPEPQESWGFGDSLMPVYAQACDRVEVVDSVASLARVIDALLE